MQQVLLLQLLLPQNSTQFPGRGGGAVYLLTEVCESSAVRREFVGHVDVLKRHDDDCVKTGFVVWSARACKEWTRAETQYIMFPPRAKYELTQPPDLLLPLQPEAQRKHWKSRRSGRDRAVQ